MKQKNTKKGHLRKGYMKPRMSLSAPASPKHLLKKYGLQHELFQQTQSDELNLNNPQRSEYDNESIPNTSNLNTVNENNDALDINDEDDDDSQQETEYYDNDENNNNHANHTKEVLFVCFSFFFLFFIEI